jgi:aspartate aminotransferase
MKMHGCSQIYVPNPTWGNHIPMFTNAGLEVKKCRYYDAENLDLDLDIMIKDIKDMPVPAA